MEQLCKHRTQGIKTRKALGLSGGAGRKTGALIRNTMEIRRASKKAGVHRKKQKVLSDTRKTRSSLGKVGGIEGNTRKRWRSTRKKGRTEIFCAVWDAICLFAGYPFETVQGLRFRYEVRGKEIFFSGKEKSVTEASVRKAVKTALELQRQGSRITGPKKRNCFGAGYLYPVLIRIGLIDLQEEAKMPEEGMPDA